VYSGRAVSTNDLQQAKTFFISAQKFVPFSEQEFVASKATEEQSSPPNQAGIQQVVPKNNQKGSETSKPNQ
ncbi:MAG: hypothetical protein RBG13Loki_0967, partial [Promethearchaeota archaeon CR_4]